MDELLLRRARQGDPEAFESLLTPLEGRIWRICWHYTGEREAASDCAQETMLKIWRSLDSYRGDCAFETWVYRIAANCCLDAIRKAKRDRSESIEPLREAGFDPPDPEPGTEEKVIAADRRQRPREGIAQLPEDQRVSFEFTPYGAEREGENLKVSRMFAPAAALTGMPRVEIVTEDGFFPDADTINAPAGSFGVGITNLNELAALIRIYSGTGEMIFDSGAGFGLEDLFRGAEVKLRGNTSGTMEKAPYRIRLAERADLLAELIPGRKESGVFYENRSWALLATGDHLNQVVGSAVAGLVGMETVCAFRYVSLYFNGDFRGVYLLAELVDQGAGTEETQSRVRVADSGFIAEADAYWWNHEFSLKTPLLNGAGFRYTVKFPDDLTEDDPRLEPIRQALTDLENAIRTGSSRLGEAADLESFAAWLLAHDYLGTADAAGSNLIRTDRLTGGPSSSIDLKRWGHITVPIALLFR